MPIVLEDRFVHGLPLDLAEVRLHEEAEHPRIEGYASVFYDGTPKTEFQLGQNLMERIMPGAFTRTLKAPDTDIVALFNHLPSQILGRESAGTLRLKEDKRGLWFSADPGNTTAGRDVVEHLRRGDITGSSFGFVARSEEFKIEEGVEIRVVTDAELFDVSVATFPAYDGTTAAIRAEVIQIRSRIVDAATKLLGSRANTERARKMLLTRQTRELQSGRNW